MSQINKEEARKEVEEAQKVQDLLELNGDPTDFERLKKTGIRYVITNSYSESHARNHIPRLSNFYIDLSGYGKLIKTFEPATTLHPGPKIKIYLVD